MPDHHLATLAIRAGQVRTHEGEHAEPIFTTSSYVFRNAAEAAARFAETEKGNIYSRFTNPTVRCFEVRLAAMEGGAACVGGEEGARHSEARGSVLQSPETPKALPEAGRAFEASEGARMAPADGEHRRGGHWPRSSV